MPANACTREMRSMQASRHARRHAATSRDFPSPSPQRLPRLPLWAWAGGQHQQVLISLRWCQPSQLQCLIKPYTNGHQGMCPGVPQQVPQWMLPGLELYTPEPQV